MDSPSLPKRITSPLSVVDLPSPAYSSRVLTPSSFNDHSVTLPAPTAPKSPSSATTCFSPAKMPTLLTVAQPYQPVKAVRRPATPQGLAFANKARASHYLHAATFSYDVPQPAPIIAPAPTSPSVAANTSPWRIQPSPFPSAFKHTAKVTPKHSSRTPTFREKGFPGFSVTPRDNFRQRQMAPSHGPFSERPTSAARPQTSSRSPVGGAYPRSPGSPRIGDESDWEGEVEELVNWSAQGISQVEAW
jgi:hypothetical protein